MKKILLVIAATVALLFVGTTAAEACHRHRVRPKVCASKWVYSHPHSWTHKQCVRQGFLYERGYYPVSTDPWIEAPYVLVWGPKGRLWVDTAGFYSVPNIR